MDLLHAGLLLIALPKPIVWLLTAIHVFFCCFLILVVLLQRGRAADLGSAFGAGPSQANLAAMSSEDLLTRATKIFAFAFMATSLFLALLSHGKAPDVLDMVPDEQPAATAPATTEPAGEAPAATTPAAETPAESPAAMPAETMPAESPATSSESAPAESAPAETTPAESGDESPAGGN